MLRDVGHLGVCRGLCLGHIVAVRHHQLFCQGAFAPLDGLVFGEPSSDILRQGLLCGVHGSGHRSGLRSGLAIAALILQFNRRRLASADVAANAAAVRVGDGSSFARRLRLMGRLVLCGTMQLFLRGSRRWGSRNRGRCSWLGRLLYGDRRRIRLDFCRWNALPPGNVCVSLSSVDCAESRGHVVGCVGKSKRRVVQKVVDRS